LRSPVSLVVTVEVTTPPLVTGVGCEDVVLFAVVAVVVVG
jgi:hypothetical protein